MLVFGFVFGLCVRVCVYLFSFFLFLEVRLFISVWCLAVRYVVSSLFVLPLFIIWWNSDTFELITPFKQFSGISLHQVSFSV